MTTYNCTYEALPTYENSLAINLPPQIATKVYALVADQSFSPITKVDRLITLLRKADIKPNTGITLYVGNGLSNVGGFSKFRQELRRRGYGAVTKLALKQKRLIKDHILISGELFTFIQSTFGLNADSFLQLSTRDLERKRDTIVINQDLGFDYQTNITEGSRTPWVAPLINGVILARDSLKQEYYLGFSEGKLKYVTKDLDLKAVLYREKEEGYILELESNNAGKVHHFSDETFRNVFLQFYTLRKRTNRG